MGNGTITTTASTRSNGWPAIMVLLVQLGLQWVLARQMVGSVWMSLIDFLELLDNLDVIDTRVAVLGLRTAY